MHCIQCIAIPFLCFLWKAPLKAILASFASLNFYKEQISGLAYVGLASKKRRFAWKHDLGQGTCRQRCWSTRQATVSATRRLLRFDSYCFVVGLFDFCLNELYEHVIEDVAMSRCSEVCWCTIQ